MSLRTIDRASLEALSRHPTPRALAPDGRRARLGEADPFEQQTRSRARRSALKASVMLAILLCSPAVARAIAGTAAAQRCAARVVERLFTAQLGGHLHVGAVDAIDAHHISLRDVSIEGADARLDLDAVALDYDLEALFAGHLVSTSGIAKGGRLMLTRAPAHDRDASARTDLVRLDRLETIDVAGTSEHALVRARIAEDGAVVVRPTPL